MQLGICCSPLRREFAVRLARRLDRNLDIATLIVDEASAHVSSTWQQASACDAVLVLLDSTAAPGPIKRDDWESLLNHDGVPPLAFIRFEACQYPKLLERGKFLVASTDLEAERWVERWLIGFQPSSMESNAIAATTVVAPNMWWDQAVDRPGVLQLKPCDIDPAQTFASQAASHFQAVFWIGAENLPAEALAGELQFRAALGTRFLFIVVYGAAPTPKDSRHSYLLIEGPAPAPAGPCGGSGFPNALMDPAWETRVIPLTTNRTWFRPVQSLPSDPQKHFDVLQTAFRSWRRESDLCRDLVGQAAYFIQFSNPFPAELCLDLALFLLNENRIVEAIVWLKLLAAQEITNEFVERAREELAWLVDDSGSYRPKPVVAGDQLDFGFPGFSAPTRVELPEIEMPPASTPPAGGKQLRISFS